MPPKKIQRQPSKLSLKTKKKKKKNKEASGYWGIMRLMIDVSEIYSCISVRVYVYAPIPYAPRCWMRHVVVVVVVVVIVNIIVEGGL